MSQKLFLHKLTANALWLYFDRLVRGALSLIVGIMVARYLGPAKFGEYSYVLGLVALLTFIGTLGLDLIIVRMLVQDPDHQPEILGTSALLRLGGGTLAYLITVAVVMAGRPRDQMALALALIIGLSPILQVGDVIDLLFQSRVQSSSTVQCKLCAGAAMITVRLGLIYMGAGLVAFAATVAGELLLMAICLAFRFHRDGGRLQRLRFNAPRAREMMRAGWPLMSATAAIAIYLRIDQVMLDNMKGDRAVAMFSAAARLTEIFVIAATVLAQTIFPAMSRLYESSQVTYGRILSAIMFSVFWISLIFSTLVALFNAQVIALVFGAQYAPAGAVLSIYVFNTVVIGMSVVFTPRYILDGTTKISFYGTVAGAIFSVVANLIMIPRYGIIGAAWSALISQMIPTMFIAIFFRRDVGMSFLRAPFAISDVAYTLRKVRTLS